jgi:hypothetical protein
MQSIDYHLLIVVIKSDSPQNPNEKLFRNALENFGETKGCENPLESLKSDPMMLTCIKHEDEAREFPMIRSRANSSEVDFVL